MRQVSENLHQIKHRILAACQKVGRKPDEVKLVAVSKGQSPEAIREAYDAGQRIFGENYAQELQKKAEELKDLDIEWHFIGHLQRNKVKAIAPFVASVGALDSLKTAETLHQLLPKSIPALIHINIGAEATKSGISAAEVPDFLRALTIFSNLHTVGLMCLPPYDPDQEKSRPFFARLRKLGTHLGLSELSMGMSHDFEVAIEEGATIVRIGTAIFGDR